MTLCITCAVVVSLFVTTTLGITGSTSATLDHGNHEAPVSHCPQVYTYETMRAGTTRYSANILIDATRSVNGFKVDLELDRPVRLIGNDVADVRTSDNVHFTLTTRRRFPPGPPISLRIFVTHPVGEVGKIKSIKIDDRLVCPSPPSPLQQSDINSAATPGSYQITPRRVVVRAGDSITLLGKVNTPLSSCQFFFPPTWQTIDLSKGRGSASTPDYEYHGAGLEQGECGIVIRNIKDDMDGVIESKIRREGEEEVENSATTLRVTNVSKDLLPVFNISPKSATISSGTELTVTCNTNRPINMCHIYLPGGRYLNYDQGVNSEVTSEHRYFGSGLGNGQCGVTLTDVDQRMNGFVVCKLGNWPEQNSGIWETDAMKVETVSAPLKLDYQTKPRRALVRPGGSVSLLGRVDEPIDICHFYMAPTYQRIDLSLGPDSISTSEYEYHGAGLDKGECGITLKRVHDAMDGIVESKVKRVSGSVLEDCATTLRVTSVAPHRLPVFKIVPNMADLHPGDNITITCNANRAINMCHIYLPGPRYLNLDMGARTQATGEYRYHGTGLENGQCGVELTNVDERLTGYVVCKLGNWPEQTGGAWETDALKIKTEVADDFDIFPEVTTTSSTIRPTKMSSTRGTTRVSTFSTPRVTTPSTTVASTPKMPDLVDIVDIKKNIIGRPSPDCGRTIPPSVPLITRGHKTYQGQWPWHVALYTSTRQGNLKYICGGTLIGTKAMLTAGHCVVQGPFDRPVAPDSLKVFLGKFHLKQWSDNGVQEKRIAEVHLHPGYNRTGYNNDIAVLTFINPIEYSDFVRPICLWDADKTDINDVEGVPGTVVGWGFDETAQETEELMMATMPVVKHTDCIWSRPSHFLQLSRTTTYCAGFRNGTSVCNGDSGGGMIFAMKQKDNTQKWYLRGLTSVSVARTQEGVSTFVCDPENYVIFTDVAQYLSWVTPYALRT